MPVVALRVTPVLPCMVVVTPERPIVTPEALVVPIEIVPAVVVAVPVSRLMLPEAPAEALPVEIVTLEVAVPAELAMATPPAFCMLNTPDVFS